MGLGFDVFVVTAGAAGVTDTAGATCTAGTTDGMGAIRTAGAAASKSGLWKAAFFFRDLSLHSLHSPACRRRFLP